jgi:serine protease Do
MNTKKRSEPFHSFHKNMMQKPVIGLLLVAVFCFSIGPLNISNAAVDINNSMPLSGATVMSDVAEGCINSVVNISSTKVVRTRRGQLFSPFFNDPFFRDFFGQDFFGVPRERREQSLGSGVIVSEDGLVLTNNHVVENAETILVTLADSRELEAEIIGTDPKSDVAVIQLVGDLENIEPIAIGDSAQLRLGEIVLAIGNPFGLAHTVTMGIVSAKGRANVGITDYEDFIQTDAAINPGNSGGALINLKGKLVGINTAIISRSGGYQGIGFAIPSNMAQAVMTSLVKHGKVVRGWLGVSGQDIDNGLAEIMGLDKISGVLVSEVVKDSPAEKAGMERGDIILKINGEEIASRERMRNKIATLGAGAEVELEIIQNEKKKDITVILAELPDTLVGQTLIDKDKGILGGLTLAPVNALTREKYELPERLKSGIVITGIEDESPARMSNLREGDVILEVNRKDINSLEDFEKAYKNSGGKVLLLVYRDGGTFYLVLRR